MAQQYQYTDAEKAQLAATPTYSAGGLADYYETIFPGYKAAQPQSIQDTWEEEEPDEPEEPPIYHSPAFRPADTTPPPVAPVPQPRIAPFSPGVAETDGQGERQLTPEASPSMANEFGHTLLRNDGPTDIYYLVDEAGIPIYWGVAKGGDSRAILEGTLVRDEPTLQTNYGVQSEPAHSSGGYVDPAHRWIGYDNAGNDVYSLTDADGSVLQWSVRRGDDSRAMLNGTLKNISAGQQTIADPQTPRPILNLGAIIVGALTRNPPTPAAAAATTPSSSTPSSSTTPPTVNTSSRFDPTHVFVGYDATGNDVYQLVDEAGRVVEWAVKHGDDSRAMIAGTVRNIGPGSPTQVVSTNRATIPGATNTPGTTTTTGTIAETVGSSLPQIITAGLIALITR